jgi:hypothetical protein
MQFEYTLSEKDFLEAQRLHGGWSTRLLPVFGGLLMLAAIFNFAGDQKHAGNALAAFLIGVALAFGRRMLLSYNYRQDTRLHDPLAAKVSDEGVKVSASTGRSTHTWKSFTRYAETKSLFLLYQGPRCFAIFPKGCLASGEADAFRELVRLKLGKGDKMERKGLSRSAWIFVVVVVVALFLLLLTVRNILRQSAPITKPAQTQLSTLVFADV